MGKGGYHGGSTIIGPWSNWFTRKGPRPKRKPLTIEELVKSAQKSAEAAQRQQAATEAEFAAIQGKPSTIGQAHKAQRKRRRRRKAQARQR